MIRPQIWTAMLLLLSAASAGAQGPDAQGRAARLTFDVASIHPTKPGTLNGMIKALPGGHGYTAQNIPVKLMISLMWKVPMRQIKGGPDWLASDPYDVEARVDGAYSIDDLHTMFQNLLADRFHLEIHQETKEGPVYLLTVDPAGLKMTPNTSEEKFDIPVTFAADGSSVGKRVPMVYLAWFLGQALQRDGRPVVDRTGLKGNWDFTLSFAPELPPDVPRESLPPGLLDRPSIFVAVKDQMGLKLTPDKGPVQFLVIDKAEKPGEN